MKRPRNVVDRVRYSSRGIFETPARTVIKESGELRDASLTMRSGKFGMACSRKDLITRKPDKQINRWH